MLTNNRMWFCICTIILSKSVYCTKETNWGKFEYAGPVTFYYYEFIPNSSLNLCIADCWTLYNWGQNYFQGEDCYCLAPVYAEASEVSGMVTTNSSIWTTYQDIHYCTEKGYTLFPDQGYCLKFFSTGKVWEDANTRCEQDGGNLISVYTQQDFTNFRSLYTHNTLVSVGAHITLNGTEFGWITGGIVNESFWKPGEPNNEFGNNEHCVVANADGRFNDRPCHYNDPYICQLLTF